ncbi:unnamed protein product [Leptosia nina]|uniref:Uncharacterized protein n=1 Tax=Leptosia nina TaxID=320188 RepID=A0AAV1K2S6_9NEOP
MTYDQPRNAFSSWIILNLTYLVRCNAAKRNIPPTGSRWTASSGRGRCVRNWRNSSACAGHFAHRRDSIGPDPSLIEKSRT